MKPTPRHSSTRQRVVAVALALVAFALGTPQLASANSTAGATILNVATVTYRNISGTSDITATASSFITVNLVASALDTYYGGPAKDTGTMTGNSCQAGSGNTYASGDTVSFLYTLGADANGDDDYTLTPSTIATTAGATSTVTMKLLDYTGNNPVDIDGSPVTFGSAIAVAVTAADTLSFPGGSLGADDGSGPFAINDIVLIEIDHDNNSGTAGIPTAFLVAAINAGNKAEHDNLGNAAHTDTGTTTAETRDTLQLKIYPNQSKTLNGTTFEFGGAVTPAFTTDNFRPVLGTTVGELKLVHVAVQTIINTANVNATVEYKLATSDGANTADIQCTSGQWKGANVSIMKQVRNVTAPRTSSFAASATGDPGDTLEYMLTIGNSGATATSVKVTDDVPDYVSLVPYTAGNYGTTVGTGASTDVFAQIAPTGSAGQATINITFDDTDNDGGNNPTIETGFGKAAGTAAGSDITFYLGDTATNGGGGKIYKLPFCTDLTSTDQTTCEAVPAKWITGYTIVYRVKID